MEAFGALGAIIGLVFVILFIIQFVNVNSAAKHLKMLYRFEKTRMIEDGLLDPETDRIKKWIFDDTGRVSPRK